VRRLLREVLQAGSLPLDLDFRLDEFAPDTFDLGEAGAAFAGESPGSKRHLLQLVAAVHGADQEHDLAEDEYLRRVAAAIGVPEADYADLVSHVVGQLDLAAAATLLRPPPPPPRPKR
jgi:uncharacterized tellurite resistance protein B-like protein